MTIESTTTDAADPRFAALGARPGTIIAVHLSYASRAEQRGRRPAHPSYFFKASSSLAASGGVIERPAGTELLAFEGEIALVIGAPARRIAATDAWNHVAWVTASNDFGLYDLRANDKGSNVRSKSGEGFTPIGPHLIDARHVDPHALRVRTWVNGELRQNDTTAGLIFPLAQIVADLAQHLTLETGDVILTGTPAGSSVVVPGDVVEVEVDAPDAEGSPTSGRLITTVVQGAHGFAPELGSLPAVDDVQRDEAWGVSRYAASPLLDNREYAASPLLDNREYAASPLLDNRESAASPLPDSREHAASPLLDNRVSAASPLPDNRVSAASPLLDNREHAASPLLDNRESAASPLPGNRESAASPLLDNRVSAASPLPDDREDAASPLPDDRASGALDAALRAKLERCPVAGLSQQLRKRGLNNVTIDGVRPQHPDLKLVGTAKTLRFVPGREDLFASHGGGYNAQKRAFDQVAAGEVLVIEARGEAGSGTLGDVLAIRARARGAAGIVTDGGVRDYDAVAAVGIPVYTAGAHPAVLGRKHVPWDLDVTIGCGGTTVQPGDIIVGDNDGVIVIPPALAEEVADAALAQEDEDAWIAARVAEGHPVDGLFPMNAAWRAKYDADRASR